MRNKPTISFEIIHDSVAAVARCMGELEPLVLVQSGTVCNPTSRDRSAVNNGYSSEMQAPLFSLAQEGRLDEFIAKLEEAFESNQVQDITTSAVMELYEYKVCKAPACFRCLSLYVFCKKFYSLFFDAKKIVKSSWRR